jgi:hypothetical protein
MATGQTNRLRALLRDGHDADRRNPHKPQRPQPTFRDE